MRLISHRGNIDGPNAAFENTPSYILHAIDKGYDVEIDVWFVNGNYFLGHDEPKDEIDYNFLFHPNFWVHCKNIEGFRQLLLDKRLNIFSHQYDTVALTSKGFLWTNAGNIITEISIAAMPERDRYWNYAGAFGVCTDYLNII